jgi:dCMP deaminase
MTDAEYLVQAYLLARDQSPDPRTQNAALLVEPGGDVVCQAVNKFPPGVVVSADRWERPLKYEYVECAERNSIYECARLGIKTSDLVMYAAWASCANCARAIIQAGIKLLVTHRPADADNGTWGDIIARADGMMREAGVELRFVTERLFTHDDEFFVRRNGKAMKP